ncbi:MULTISPECIES: VOC family protein [unclassified Mesorhizobium]|uniref:VOC family protein n=1 Tax=unclassified Mesorhizobium TaxID=325217 RepID=UPI000BAFB32D|nr:MULTISPECIES: VOC family protein [unclassified Mesorhizobium]TGT59994.1 VOC family protein [Mesorhizobium sp. M00.F.Ca.ET.170.01.1.1]AZO08155.1 VOC family protein [Mesorhizobium sp. M3A.F.Ca.ET.080.04.2.1]PBB85777.1 lactoylglutathione lyase [Mesorhizobium sp. WSM3876]RWB70911.1 MAG: VOC family protein [Mesorhizobium sp.]RWB89146.1 MAG: VOC family protein [Mesorhizobium sp.]
MRKATAHPLDHLVLPTRSLEVARNRLSALGFVVAPTGVHPFGTENCCVFFSDDTYLEPLAIGDETTAERAIAEGNVFVARDRLFRDRLGDEGFSAVVFATADADADHARYVASGLSAGNMLSFSRAFTDAAGKSDTASFKLAFATGTETSEAFLFACQRINAPKIDRTALQAHANGVAGILEIVAVGDRPSAQVGLMSAAAGKDAENGDKIELPNAVLTVLKPAAFTSRFGVSAGSSSELRFAAIVFSIGSSDAAASVLAANAIEHNLSGNDIVVPAAPGQGAVFIFREIP